MGGDPAPRWLTDEAIGQVRATGVRPFDDAEYEGRLDRIRHRMAVRGLDALVVLRPSSVEYLCGYHTAETAPQPLVVTGEAIALYVPDLELGRALVSARVDEIHHCGYSDALQGLGRFLGHAVPRLRAGARVGLETADTTTPPQALAIVADHGATVVDGDYLVERERLRLSDAEIHCVERAAAITADGVRAAVTEAVRDGATDSSVAAAVAAALTRHANSASAWGPVVVTGERAGIPHSSWVGEPLGPGATFLEFSGADHRYHAPVMRTLFRGPPDGTDRQLAELARTVVTAVLDAARPGVAGSQVAARASAALGRLPDDVVFHQLFGYPVGLAHKPHWMDGMPFHLAAGNDEPLEEGMVFHIPGSFRRLGRSGVGLSQTFVVEREGARVLTHGPAETIDIAEQEV